MTTKLISNSKLAITCIAGALSLAACAEPGTLEVSEIEEVEASSYQQALTPQGDIDCEPLHDALREYGIDPAALTPEVVFDACVNTGQVDDDLCQRVANACFGEDPDNCDDGHDNGGGDDDRSCEEVYERLEDLGIEPDDLQGQDVDQLWEMCVQSGHSEDECQFAAMCLGIDSNGGGGDDGSDPDDPNGDVCELVYDEAGNIGIDPAGVSADEAYQLCLQHNYDEAICQTVADCFNDGQPGGGGGTDPDNTDPSDFDCAMVEELLADQGIQTPVDDQTGEALLEECENAGYDFDLCLAALECVQP